MNRDQTKFDGLLDEYFETLLAEHPLMANYAGLRDGEGKLGRADRAHEQSWERRRQDALRALDKISPRPLTSEQHLDRLAWRAQLQLESEDFLRGRHALDPDALDTLLGALLHELQRGEDEPKRATENIRGLLRDTPKFLAESAALLDRPEPVWRKIMEQTAEGAPTLFTAVAAFLHRTSNNSDANPRSSAEQRRGPGRGGAEPRRAVTSTQPPLSPRSAAGRGDQLGSVRDISLLESAQKAVTQYRDAVRARPLAPAGSFAIGAEETQRRVREQLGLDYSLGEIESLALGEVERLNALLKKECARFGRKAQPEEIIKEAREAWNPGDDLIGVYRAETQRVADAFRAAKAVTFPVGDELRVRAVPEFMRHLFPTAAYSQPGAFEKKQRGTFWINDLSATKTTDVEKRCERQQHFGLSLTCAHEAYPGHHLQFVLANQHARKWRRLFAHAVFYEGWTLWCEQMMVDLRIDRSPWLRVQQLHDALWRAHRILVDLRLQTRRYSYESAVKHMMKHLGFTRARAEGDVNWYTSSPTVPMSYWLGRLENERLRARLVDGRGWSLRKFNDWLLSHGTIPQSWIERHGLE